MYKVTFLAVAEGKDVPAGKTRVGARTMIETDDANDALKQAHLILAKRTPAQREKIVGVKVEKQETGIIKWA